MGSAPSNPWASSILSITFHINTRHLDALLHHCHFPPGELHHPPTHLSGLEMHNPIPLSLSPSLRIEMLGSAS
ncbi:hypothetical protein GW17_00050313 [Ensete ventricosum]|nr:hypothetical protein GW17_00050313 [Ensete ventricosum]